MSTQLHPATEKYSGLIAGAQRFVSDTLISVPERDLESAATVLRSSHRIFCMGSGSSHPAALFIAQTLACSKMALASRIVGLSEFLCIQSLCSRDVLILVSQGYNRADARIVLEFARRHGVQVVLLSAIQTRPDGIAGFLRFSPAYEDERIFCRPVGVITSTMVAAMLARKTLGLPTDLFSSSSLIADIDQHSLGVLNEASQLVRDSEHVVVLGSGLIAPACGNIALSLREGAGLQAEHFEIEFYAHGQYAAHLRRWSAGAKLTYLLCVNTEDPVSLRAANRIAPLLASLKVPHIRVETTGSSEIANVKLLRIGSKIVEYLLQRSGYDMNNPVGKEENRGFQEVATDYYFD
jgi:hypothetical protein